MVREGQEEALKLAAEAGSSTVMSRPLLHVASSAICCLVSKRAARPAGVRGFAKYRGVNVVLLQDLGERGFLGDEVVVKPGYARNFLIPTKKAVYATPVNKDKHLIERTEEARRLLEERRDFLIFRERVERRAVTCTRTITLEGQTLEQPITKTQLAEMMRKQLKYSLIKEERLRLPRGTEIKQAGEYLVKLEMDTPELMKDAGAPPTEVLTIRVEVKRDETKRQLKVADAAEEGAGAEAAEGGKAGGKK